MKPIDRTDLDAVEDFTMIAKSCGVVILLIVAVVMIVSGLLGLL